MYLMYTYHFGLEAGKKMIQSQRYIYDIAEPPSNRFAWLYHECVVGDFVIKRCATKLESPVRVGVIHWSTKSLLKRLPIVLLVIGSGWIRRECSSDGFRDRGRRRNVGTLSMKAILISCIFDGDGSTVRCRIRKSALDHLSRFIWI